MPKTGTENKLVGKFSVDYYKERRYGKQWRRIMQTKRGEDKAVPVPFTMECGGREVRMFSVLICDL
jgi:hypothetical protein